MAVFKYRMQNIPDIKQKLEESAKMEFSEANARVAAEEEKLSAIEMRKLAYEKEGESLRKEQLYVQEIKSNVQAISVLGGMVKAQEREVELFNLLDIKNKEALGSRISITDNLAKEHYDKVYIIGHALGEADYSVFDAINKDAEVICSYYLEDEKDKLEHTLKRLKLQYTMVPSQEIFK